MTSSTWQALQDPDDAALDTQKGKFRWNGKFIANKAVIGSWVQLGQVKAIEDFKPGARISSKGKSPLQALTFKDTGRTDDMLMIWSGNTLLNLHKNEALKMTVKQIEGIDYLFIESGGFSSKAGSAWKSPLYVMKRK